MPSRTIDEGAPLEKVTVPDIERLVVDEQEPEEQVPLWTCVKFAVMSHFSWGPVAELQPAMKINASARAILIYGRRVALNVPVNRSA